MRIQAFVVIALLLAGCAKPAEQAADASEATNLAAIAPAAPGGAAQESRSPVAKPQPASIPMLAYRYDYRIAAPPAGVRALVARHEAACVAAGPSVCQVTSSEVAGEGEGEVRAALSLRAAPAWLQRFRAGLAGDAKTAGGEVLSAGSSAEDLTRQIVDTEAAMRAKTTLRDRLQELLATRPGKVSELLELEQALADVQQQIDATQSELAVMRTRIATSALQINYVSTGISGRPQAWAPLGQALGDTGAILAGSLAALVRIVVAAAPWVAVLAGLWFLIRKRLPKRRPKPPSVPEPPAA
jgi:hypothetical protein